MSRMYARAAWAGVVVKMSDGTTYAFEIAHPTRAEVTVEHEMYDTPFGDLYAHVMPTGRSHVRIELEGLAANSARFARMADDIPQQGEIEPPRTLPAGEQRALPS